MAVLTTGTRARRASRFGIRRDRRLLSLGATLVLVVGCAKVNPQPDFDAAAARIRDRLDVDDVFDPANEPLVEQKVRELLAGGLTADEAVGVALLNNRSFQSAFQSIGVSRADVVQSGLWTNPSLVIGTRFIEGGGRSEITAGFAQQLVDLWQIPVRKKIAEAQLEQTVLGVLDEAVRIATTTRSLYYDVLWRQRLDQIASDNLELARRSLRLAQVRLDAGETSPLDTGLVRTQVLQSENAALLAKRDLENARLALRQIMGMARWEDAWQLNDLFADAQLEVPQEAALIATAMDGRFDVRIADARVDAAAQEVDLQLMRVFPSILVGLQGERTEQRALPGRKLLADTARASIAAGQLTPPAIQSRGQRDIARNQIIDALLGASVQLTLPIWDQNQAQIAKANLTYQRLVREREFLRDAIVTDIRQASNDARTARRQFALYERELLPQAESNIKTAQSRYENGEESILILIESQDEMFSQKRQSADALRELLIAGAELARVCGGRLPRDATNEQSADETNRTGLNRRMSESE
ncbi:MAG: TolC family protein [Phycisphaerales bacterium]|nr:TolC family protein [Phycisphaerales bacterium]MCB9856211.1 TolC family protein [Phycisphaerales bacterium]MCB9863350.1 TolC family protein [Phycisphaerales bacterium]